MFHACLGDHGIAEECATTWPAQKYLLWCLGTSGALSQSRCDRLWWGSAVLWEELHPELLWGQQEAVGEERWVEGISGSRCWCSWGHSWGWLGVWVAQVPQRGWDRVLIPGWGLAVGVCLRNVLCRVPGGQWVQGGSPAGHLWAVASGVV